MARKQQLELFAAHEATDKKTQQAARKAIKCEPLQEPETRQFWSQVVLNPRLPMRERLRASENLARSMGMFTDKVDQTGEQRIIIEHRHESVG